MKIRLCIKKSGPKSFVSNFWGPLHLFLITAMVSKHDG